MIEKRGLHYYYNGRMLYGRKRLQDVFVAFLEERACTKYKSIWTNGKDIHSYQTCIATRTATGLVILNQTRYSVTTSNHQNALETNLRVHEIPFVRVSGLPWEATPWDLEASIDRLEVCMDCFTYTVGGEMPTDDTTDFQDRLPKIREFLDSLPKNKLVTNPTSHYWFSWEPCELCGSELAGNRWELVVVETGG